MCCLCRIIPTHMMSILLNICCKMYDNFLGLQLNIEQHLIYSGSLHLSTGVKGLEHRIIEWYLMSLWLGISKNTNMLMPKEDIQYVNEEYCWYRPYFGTCTCIDLYKWLFTLIQLHLILGRLSRKRKLNLVPEECC